MKNYDVTAAKPGTPAFFSSSGIFTFIAKVFARAISRLKRVRKFVFHRDVFVVFKASSDRESVLDGESLREISDLEIIYDIYKNSGRKYQGLDRIITSRLRHGYAFFVYEQEGEPIFTTWMIHHKHRFIDEVAVRIHLNSKSLFIRDSFCTEQFRGHGYFQNVIALIVKQYYPDALYIFSDTEESNRSSVRVHEKCGFEPLFRIHYFTLFNRFLIRNIEQNTLNVEVYKEDKFVVSLNDEFRQYVRDHMA